MTTYKTGYSSIPKNYDDYQAKKDEEIVFGRRHSDVDLSAPQGSVNTRAYDSTDKLWSGSNGTIGLTPDPKLNKSIVFPTVEEPETLGAEGAIGSSHIPDYVDPFAKHTRLTGRHGDPTFTTTTAPITNEVYLTDWEVARSKIWDKYPEVPIPPATTTGAVKFDDGKTDWSLMPFEAIEEINKVLDFGAKKYAAHNWKTGSGFKYTRVLSSLLRHTFAWARGEDLDPESGLSHLSHMGCNIVFLIYYNKYNARYNNDDRVTR